MSTTRTVLNTPSARNPKSFPGVSFKGLDAAIRDAGISGAHRDLIVGIARECGSKWTQIRFADFAAYCGVRSHRTLSQYIPLSIAGQWIERRPDPRGGKSFEYRAARRFHVGQRREIL